MKCITVKTYGGRRYTTARHLVLARPQKTRGKFYLFLLYEANGGTVPWSFMPGKGSEHVCRFMRQTRRWYPEQKAWVALDQDRPHPCKSHLTRRTMRGLNLHWISLPQGSPDDNPVETLFSDVQLMVLDNSSDLNARQTQHRISAHLHRRNRRQDRCVRIHYLSDSHNGR